MPSSKSQSRHGAAAPMNLSSGSFTELDETVLNGLVISMGASAGDAVTRMVNSLLEYIPKVLTNIDQAQAEEDWTELRMQVHGLKGNCAMYGAVGLADLCNRCEQMIDLGQLQEAAVCAARLKQGYEDLRAALLRWKEEHGKQ